MAIQFMPQISVRNHERDIRAATRPDRDLPRHQRGQKRFDRRSHRFRSIEMQHVPRSVDADQFSLRNVRDARTNAGEAVGRRFAFGMGTQPFRYERFGCGHPQYRRRDLLPHGDHFFHPVHRGGRQLVPRIRVQARAAVRLRLRPVAREELRLVARQPRIVLLQLIGDRREIRVRSERRRIAQRVEPLGNLGRRPRRRLRRNAEAFERHHARHALRPHARVEHDHIAPEAVPDEPRRLVAGEVIEQCVEIREVVGEPIAVLAPLGPAETAPIGRQHVPFARQRVDEKLERGTDIHPAVQHEQLGRTRVAPASHVITQAAYRDELRCRRSQRLISFCKGRTRPASRCDIARRS